MDLVQSSVLLSNDVVFLRVIIRYGERLFYWNEHHLEKLFAGLRETINSLIFIHNDCYISKEKPKLSPQYSRQMLKQANDSLHNPITFVANFNFDCDSEDTGPRVEFKPPQKVPCAMHQLNVDAFFAVDPEIVEGDLFDTLRSNVSEFLTSYNETLKSILAKEKSIPRSLTAYYFHHEDKLIRVFYPPFCEKELQWREAIHKGLDLPRKPIIRRGLAIFPTRSFKRLLGPNEENLVCPHLLIPSSGPNAASADGNCEIIRGRYTYKHYLQDGIDDKNWGCAYRSLQTLASWLLWQGVVAPLRELPTIKCIQEALVRVGDKTAKFIGSRQWIGSLEVSFCLQELYGVQCRLLPVSRGAEFTATAAAVLAGHFASGGGPVMVGGGQLAHTIVGVNTSGPRARYLILDPHYTGQPGNVATILGKGWVGWKDEGFWRADVPYNLCLVPPVDAGAI